MFQERSWDGSSRVGRLGKPRPIVKIGLLRADTVRALPEQRCGFTRLRGVYKCICESNQI